MFAYYWENVPLRIFGKLRVKFDFSELGLQWNYADARTN